MDNVELCVYFWLWSIEKFYSHFVELWKATHGCCKLCHHHQQLSVAQWPYIVFCLLGLYEFCTETTITLLPTSNFLHLDLYIINTPKAELKVLVLSFYILEMAFSGLSECSIKWMTWTHQVRPVWTSVWSILLIQLNKIISHIIKSISCFTMQNKYLKLCLGLI